MRKCDHQGVQQGFMVKVGEEGRLRSPDPRGDRHAAGRAHHAALQQDDLRRLIAVARLAPRCRLAEPALRIRAPRPDRPTAHEHARIPPQPERQCAVAGALLFFLGVGLTLIFGIMRIVNFAHGTLYMLGAFIGYSLVRWTGSFWMALALAPIVGRPDRHGVRARHPAPALPARRARLPDGDVRPRPGRHARRCG